MSSKPAHFVTIRLENKRLKYPSGIPLLDVLDRARPKDGPPVVLAKVDGLTANLLHPVVKSCRVEWIDAATVEARRANQASLCMILGRAARDCFPGKRLVIDHSLGSGLYCAWKSGERVGRRQISRIEKRMRELIDADEPVVPVTMSHSEAARLLESRGERLDLEKTGDDVILYRYGGTPVFTGSPVFHSTRNVSAFALYPWKPGLVLAVARDHEPPVFSPVIYRKLTTVFREYRRWESILGIETPADINRRIADGGIDDLIKIAEALHEKKVAEIAESVRRRGKGTVVFISGPSSSGKTTFTKRLAIQLRVIGLSPVMISLDDYFLDRDRTPPGPDGRPDFEALEAVDINRFGDDLGALLRGETVQLPRYDFVAGRSVPGIKTAAAGQPVLVEGLHGLNQRLTSSVPEKRNLKVYVSALTQLNLTDQVRLPTSDVRLLRRLVRDSRFRGHGAESTLSGWPSVRQGEEKHIFPFQERADCMFNTSLTYELSVLRLFAEPLLVRIPNSNSCFSEARRLLDCIRSFQTITADEVPPTSILREFIGGSSFRY
jgi:uridine kinase